MKPYYTASSKQIPDLFDQDINYEQIVKIANYIKHESLRAYYVLMGIIPEYLSLSDILGQNLTKFRGNRSLETTMDVDVLGEKILSSFEVNKEESRNTVSFTYFKMGSPPHNPLFFIQASIPIEDKAIVLLNKRKGYLYIGNYDSRLKGVEEYNSATERLKDEDRFLSYRSIRNMINNSREIHAYYMGGHEI